MIDDANLAEIPDATVELPDIAQEEYAVEWWDTRTGEVTNRADLSHDAGALRLSVPPFTHDTACKVVVREG